MAKAVKEKKTPEEISRISRSSVSRSKESERKIANLMTEWSGVQFRRRRVEGKDVGTIALNSVADVIPIVGDFNFAIEVKIEKKFSLVALMKTTKTCTFTSWWLQVNHDCSLMTASRQRQTLPMLFFRHGVNFNWLALSVEGFESIEFRGRVATMTTAIYSSFGVVSGNVSHSPKNKVIVSMQLPDVVFMRCDDFFASAVPSSVFNGGVPQCPAATAIRQNSE